MSWLFPDFHFQWLAEETRRNLPHELDFTHEAGNQEKCATMFRHLKFMKVWRREYVLRCTLTSFPDHIEMWE